MHIDKRFIGQKIKEYRKKEKLSQLELAEKVGLSDKHIGRIEAGKYLPNFINFINILEVLNINFSDLGIKIKQQENKNKMELLKLIYTSNDKEINLYLKLIKTLKEDF